MRYSFVVLMVALLGGCASQSSNMAVGTDMTYVSLKDQREAVMTVKDYPEIPAGATVVGKVDASRCHRNALHTAPTSAEVLIDLKIAAYARGADGISQVAIEPGSGLLQNCWSILSGTATAFQIKK